MRARLRMDGPWSVSAHLLRFEIPGGPAPMGLLTKPIDQLEELLGHSPHPAIVMLPLGTFVVEQRLRRPGRGDRQKSYDDAARISTAIGLVGAWPRRRPGFATTASSRPTASPTTASPPPTASAMPWWARSSPPAMCSATAPPRRPSPESVRPPARPGRRCPRTLHRLARRQARRGVRRRGPAGHGPVLRGGGRVRRVRSHPARTGNPAATGLSPSAESPGSMAFAERRRSDVDPLAFSGSVSSLNRTA